MITQLEKDWEKFFGSGFYSQGWEWLKDPQGTREEVEGILKLFNPPPNSHILDWCGGWGRHSIEFAKAGFEVTLLDFAPNHIQMAEEAAKEVGVELNLICADFRETPASIQADFAVNLFTAGLGYLTEEDDLRALVVLHAALKPGAKVLIDTMNLFWLAKNYQPRGWRESEDGRVRLFGVREFDFLTNHNHSREILWVKGEEEREAILDHRIYSPAKLAAVLRRAGFGSIELYGDFDGQQFTFDSPRIIMIGERK